MKKLKWILGLLLLGILLTGYFNYPKLNLISGFAAKNMASTVFVSNREALSVNIYDHDKPLISLAESKVDLQNNNATATVFGLMERKAVYKEGLGAVLVNKEYDEHAFDLLPSRNIQKDTLPFPFGNNGVKDTILANVDYAKLEAAMTNAFADSTQNTRSLLIAHKNELIGEKYLRGFDENTAILGWSMTKSVLATLYGILEYKSLLSVEDRPFADEIRMKNSKMGITLNHLLRMQSGLSWDEDYFKISDVTKMLFLDSDMTLAQKNNKVIASPGEVWNYSSGTSNLLSGILRAEFDTHQEYLDFPYAELIDKTGMYSMLLETDLVGNYVGSSYGWATTRDWAKFGLLYLNKGDWNGERIFAETWIDYITTPTKNSEGKYGAHFWLNAGGRYKDIPRDLYSVNGFQGQRVFIIPSKELVVVRMGIEEQTDEQFNTLLSEILLAIK